MQRTNVVFLIFLSAVSPALGQPFWMFGTSQPRHHGRTRRPAAPQMAPIAEAPQPVPRPHFPTDPVPPPPAIAKAPVPTATVPDGALPVPPERPTELTPKSAPAIPREVHAPPVTPPAMTPPAMTPPAAPSSNAMVKTKPDVAPSGAKLGEAPGQPVDDATCPGRLKARNVIAEPIAIGPQPDVRCTVVEAVRLTGLSLPDGSKIDFPDRPTIACTTADAFSSYVHDLLAPLAEGTFGSTIAAVWTGPGLECRARDHIFGAKLSAHGQGLAVDIAQLKLADGRIIAVGAPKGDTDQGFETAARAGGCGYFHTVLGPGSDTYHRTHWHFDLEVRGSKGDSKYCK